MEETLGKRIVASRKRLGLTQDALAEKLGVTAQAVSKWENDQSCPDITMLPKLAEVFSISTDELLGLEKPKVHEAEIVPESDASEPEGLHVQNGNWELQWDGGRKSSVGFAAWVLLVGSILLGMHFNWPRPMYYNLWELLWTTALFIFGLFGLFPKFSVFRFGCAFFGGYFLLEYGGFLHGINMGIGLILPICLLLFGLSLLAEALRKPKHGNFHVTHDGRTLGKSKSYCDVDGETFSCAASFAGNTYPIVLSRLSEGNADVSFGELKVDLSGCEEFSEGCCLELHCAFGELEVLLPKTCRAEVESSSSFASIEVKGNPDPNASSVIHLVCSASFGEICVRYISL